MARKSIQTLVYEELKNNIMSLNLKPGQAMSTQEIASKLNVSRTPVREAFLQLQKEGLVEMIPQRETIVSRINLDRVDKEKFIRECLELGAINYFLNKKDRIDTIEKMSEYISIQKKCVEDNDFMGFIKADDSFHKVIFETIGQEMAWQTIENGSGHYDRFRYLFVQQGKGAESSIAQHAEIVKYLALGNEEKARQELTSHIQRVEIDQSDLMNAYPDYFAREEKSSNQRIIGSLS